MATVVPVVMQSQPLPDDDIPLLGDGLVPMIEGGPVSPLIAHRRRLTALLRAAWDSGVACVCGAAVVFSFAALFVKLMGAAIPVFQIVAVRSLASFAVCAAYARAARISPLFGRRTNLRFLISRGLFGAAAMTTYYFSIRLLPLADAVTLFFLNPAITAVAAWAIMREPLGLRGVAGVLVSLAGLVLLTRPPFLFGHGDETAAAAGGGGLHGDGGVGVGTAGATGDAASGGWDEQRLLGSMFGLLSALLSAGAFISIRHIGKSEPALVVSVYFHVCAAASSLAPLAAGVPARAVWPSGPQWALLLGVSGCSFWGQILIGRGFQLLHAARASAINLTQVVYSYILGLLFLHESLTLTGGCGSLLIAAGAVLVNLRPKKPVPVEGSTDGADGATAPAAAGAAAAGKGDVAAAADGIGCSSDSNSSSGGSGSQTASAECRGAGRSEPAGLVAVVAGSAGTVEMAGVWSGGGVGGSGANVGGEGFQRGAEEDALESERRPLLLQVPSPADLGTAGAFGEAESCGDGSGVRHAGRDGGGCGGGQRPAGQQAHPAEASHAGETTGRYGGDGTSCGRWASFDGPAPRPTAVALVEATDPQPGCGNSICGGAVGPDGSGRMVCSGDGGSPSDGGGGGLGERPPAGGSGACAAGGGRDEGSPSAASPPDSAGG